jgi:hypothetical protein
MNTWYKVIFCFYQLKNIIVKLGKAYQKMADSIFLFRVILGVKGLIYAIFRGQKQ